MAGSLPRIRAWSRGESLLAVLSSRPAITSAKALAAFSIWFLSRTE